MSRRLDKYEKLPVYQKAQELFDLAEVIAVALKEDEMKEHLAAQMLSNAAMVQAKIAGAEGGAQHGRVDGHAGQQQPDHRRAPRAPAPGGRRRHLGEGGRAGQRGLRVGEPS